MTSFCEACGARLASRRVAGRRRKVCPRCGSVVWGNALPAVRALIERGGRVLLARRGSRPYPGAWDTPGGFVEADEHPEAALVREVAEETGLRVRPLSLFAVRLDRGSTAHVLSFYYRARIVGGSARPAPEFAELRWFASPPRSLAFPDAHAPVLRRWKRRPR